ncbi:MAG: J domain-containing protein [Dehalococcoidia bacterium]
MTENAFEYQWLKDYERGKNYYEVLGVIRGHPDIDEVLRAVYASLMRTKYHPDHNPGVLQERTALVNQAYETLRDVHVRTSYDTFLDGRQRTDDFGRPAPSAPSEPRTRERRLPTLAVQGWSLQGSEWVPGILRLMSDRISFLAHAQSVGTVPVAISYRRMAGVYFEPCEDSTINATVKTKDRGPFLFSLYRSDSEAFIERLKVHGNHCFMKTPLANDSSSKIVPHREPEIPNVTNANQERSNVQSAEECEHIETGRALLVVPAHCSVNMSSVVGGVYYDRRIEEDGLVCFMATQIQCYRYHDSQVFMVISLDAGPVSVTYVKKWSGCNVTIRLQEQVYKFAMHRRDVDRVIDVLVRQIGARFSE